MASTPSLRGTGYACGPASQGSRPYRLNGALSLHIQVSAAEGTVVLPVKPSFVKKRVPEGKQLLKVQAQAA